MATDLVQALKIIYHDPKVFVTKFLGASPEPWQEQFLQNVATNNRVAVKSGHGVGKTTALAWLILWFLLTRNPVKIGVTAPAAATLEGGLWNELRVWHNKLPPEFKDLIEITSDAAFRRHDKESGIAYARTSSRDKPEALAGLHSENMVFIVDEASGVEEAVFETARGAMSTKGAKTILTGNPTKAHGYFYNAFNLHPDNWKLMTVSCADSSRVDPDYIQEIRDEHGEDSNVFRIRVAGQFPEDDDDVLIARSAVEAATKRDVDAYDAPVVWGLDVARFGDDRTALAKRKGNVLLERIHSWQGKGLMETAGVVVDEYNMTPTPEKPDVIYVDAIGMGAGVADRLREMGLPAVDVNVAESPAIKERFAKQRDELWWRAREWFENRNCRIPEDDVLIAELCSPSYKFDSSGKIKIEPKSEMKKRGKRSPDLADAFCLTLVNTQTSRATKKRARALEVNTSYVV